MSNVVSLVEKLEVWKPVYEKDNLRVHVSSHGKFKIYSGDKITQLEFFDSVTFLKELSEALEYVMCSMYKDTD
jgi:hypothetical protein